MPSKRKISVPAASKPAVKPLNTAPLGTVSNAQIAAGTSNVIAAPKPAKAAKPLSGVPSVPAVPVIRGLARAARVIDAARYPREHDSDADMQYLSFFASFAKLHNGTFTIAETLQHRPAGITINNNPARALRLTKAGFFTVAVSGNDRTYTATALAKTHKLYSAAAPFKA